MSDKNEIKVLADGPLLITGQIELGVICAGVDLGVEEIEIQTVEDRVAVKITNLRG